MIERWYGLPWRAVVVWLAVGLGWLWAVSRPEAPVHAPALPVRDADLWEVNH